MILALGSLHENARGHRFDSGLSPLKSNTFFGLVSFFFSKRRERRKDEKIIRKRKKAGAAAREREEREGRERGARAH